MTSQNLKKQFINLNLEEQKLTKKMFDEFLPNSEKKIIHNRIDEIEKELEKIQNLTSTSICETWILELHGEKNSNEYT